MIGKVLAGIVLAGLVVTSIMAGLGFLDLPGSSLLKGDTGTTAITLLSVGGGGALVFLLNMIGLGFRPKYFGVVGIVISGLLLAYGIYVLVTKNSIIHMPPKAAITVGGISTGAGGVALLTSAGILTM